MNKRKVIKNMAITLVLAAPLLLSGCYASTPTIEGNSGGNYATYPTARVEQSTAPVQGATQAGALGAIATLEDGGTPTVSTIGGSGGWVTANLSTAGTIAPATTVPASPSPSPSASPTPSASLKKGDSGTAVRELQQRLKSLGFYSGTVDGDFGEGTETAVKRFQSQYGLTADGKAGKQTLSKLATAKATARPTSSPTPKPTDKPSYTQDTYLKYGSSGALVKKMQERLISLGYLVGTATGSFDRMTEAGVIAFQKRNTAYYDGVAGKLTLDALFSSSAKSTSTPSGFIGISLKEGSTNAAAVRALQTRLKALGYYSGAVDGDFGEGTTTAVKNFQSASGIVADGVAGGTTLSRLFSSSASEYNAPTATPRITEAPTGDIYVLVTAAPDGSYVTLQRGSYGTLVRTMQQALRTQGYYTGTVDGYFGEGTELAVKAFQRAKGLQEDGKAGSATLRVLYEGDFPIGS